MCSDTYEKYKCSHEDRSKRAVELCEKAKARNGGTPCPGAERGLKAVNVPNICATCKETRIESSDSE